MVCTIVPFLVSSGWVGHDSILLLLKIVLLFHFLHNWHYYSTTLTQFATFMPMSCSVWRHSIRSKYFLSKSFANTSELLEDLEDMFPCYSLVVYGTWTKDHRESRIQIHSFWKDLNILVAVTSKCSSVK